MDRIDSLDLSYLAALLLKNVLLARPMADPPELS